MNNTRFAALDAAKRKFISGDAVTAASYYGRANAEGIPASIVNIHQITKGYMFLALDEYSPKLYFDCLGKIRNLASQSEEYKQEYIKAIDSLLRFRELFLRNIALNYFLEISATSWSSNYTKSINDLFEHLKNNMSKITDEDCYHIKKYYPSYDLQKLKTELMKVEAYCLNLLLMYTAVKSTHYEGKKYYGTTTDYGDYMVTEVKARDSYSSNAVVLPRLHLISLEAYYDDYLEYFNSLTKEINKRERFSSPEELKREISRLVQRKSPKYAEEKEFYKYSKVQAKEDYERQSYFNMISRFPLFSFGIKGFLRKVLGMDQVGSFELDVIFTRKKLLGVCNMIAWANNWSVETVRAVTIAFSILSAFAYIGLAISMKVGFYLTNLSVKKH